MAHPVYIHGRIYNGKDARAKPHFPRQFVETFRCRACVNAGDPGVLVLKADFRVGLRVHCPRHGADPQVIHYGEIAKRKHERLWAESYLLEHGGRPKAQRATVSLRANSEEEDWM